jgi:polysaccharide biosynthesis/export protein
MGTYDGPLSRGTTGLKFETAIRSPAHPMGKALNPGTLRCRWLEHLPLPQIRAKIGAALATKAFRMRAPDARENVIVIDADEVTATVAEYRPIYVNGDVSKPGEYPYRPSITARQLVALAGGFDIMRMRMNNPYLEAADLRSEYNTLWTEFAKEQARI